MHHSVNAAEPSDPAAERFNARLGLFLFAGYTAGYAAFVLANAFAPTTIEPVSAGFALIGGALVLALLYAALCRTPAAGVR